MSDTWKPDICIYHGNCDDGFGAAWAIWRRWGNEVAYVPGTYGKPLPDATGKHVLFVDFSAKRPDIDAMAQVAKSIVIIDHHKTAEADLAPFTVNFSDGVMRADDVPSLLAGCYHVDRPPVVAWFDMNQSGAVMAWDFAHGIPRNDPPPTMLALIQDHDLWRFAFGDRTKQFSAALRTYPMAFETWDDIAEHPDDLVKEGAAILRGHNANIQKFVADAYWDYVGGYFVPVVNVPYHYASDTAHALLNMFPEAMFTACWFRRGDGMVQWSLRSEDGRMDVSEIAKRSGGGGHRNAAGFQVSAAVTA
ncbi:MAG: DHHA1 domain-containing protein [Afipia sp.]|nr:DHHA1 domain-containing protein [Afipia sp.]